MHWETIIVVALVLIGIGLFAYFYLRHRDYGKRIHRLPLDLMGFKDMPAVPFVLLEIPGTLLKLGLRAKETTQAKWGLSNTYTIGNVTANGYSFLYGRGKDVEDAEEAERVELRQAMEKADLLEEISVEGFKRRAAQNDESADATGEDPITMLSLTAPEQFAMGWTVYAGVYENALPFLEEYSDSLRDVAVANRTFWPTIAQHGFAYNLLILQKVTSENASNFAASFGQDWTPAIQELVAQGLLYAIDLRLFEKLQSNVVKGNPRFTPATLTLLSQDAATKALTPIAVVVSGQNGAGKQVYTFGQATNGAWLYALSAARTSVTLYGIWLGHVYHWHIVSAALVMTLGNHVEETHPLRIFMAPQSDYLIPFNNVLLLLWKSISPPTSVSSMLQFLALTNDFAMGRSYLDDDPDVTLMRNGIRREDFTVDNDWDAYPIAGQLLSVFDAAHDYVHAFVFHTWASDTAVVEDKPLQAWLAANTDPKDGNIVGMPPLNTRENLATTLRSFVYRLTAHGASRLNSTANPVLSFVANMPPCLQRTDIPAANAELDTATLLTYLPNTGSIGEMLTFLFTFIFSAPYVPFLPLAGNDVELIWPGGATEPRNKALIDYRGFIEAFIRVYDQPAELHQWPRNIET